ncbi:hypothetical protein ACFT38_00435 [Streptomyces sp. NPDC056975]|uniref:hypothetical protein n=1 Tax=Streptomyces sp. NPDC056975 TaxID=3345985 RepID=UPI00362765EF
MRYRVLAVALMLALGGAVGCSSSSLPDGKQAAASSKPARTYLHPVKDLYRVTRDCDDQGAPGVRFWLRNHAGHDMAYDIRYEFLGTSGRAVGSAEGVFTLSAHQVLGDQELYSAGGKCGPTMRLAFIKAYDSTGDGADQPTF